MAQIQVKWDLIQERAWFEINGMGLAALAKISNSLDNV